MIKQDQTSQMRKNDYCGKMRLMKEKKSNTSISKIFMRTETEN